MKKLCLTLAVALGLTVTGATMQRADAYPLGNGIQAAADQLNIVDHVQYIWGGRNYCWYDGGWNGPGWYWCGRYLTPGFGWGGGIGWHNWRRGGVIRSGVRGAGMRSMRMGGGGGMRSMRMGGGGGGKGAGGRRSDITLKHDITLLGHLENGLGFYRFSYNGSDKAYVGVMAQEVQTVMPQAVARGSDGYLRVYYEKVGVKFQSYDQWITAGARIPAGTIRH